MTKSEVKTELARAAMERIEAYAHYVATWRAEPTAKGFPKVDKALAKLHKAEAVERGLQLVLEGMG